MPARLSSRRSRSISQASKLRIMRGPGTSGRALPPHKVSLASRRAGRDRRDNTIAITYQARPKHKLLFPQSLSPPRLACLDGGAGKGRRMIGTMEFEMQFNQGG